MDYALKSPEHLTSAHSYTKNNHCQCYEIAVDICSEPRVRVKGLDRCWEYQIQSTVNAPPTPGEMRVIEFLKVYTTRMYSEDKIEGLKKWTENVTNVLDFPIHTINFSLDAFPQQNREIIDWLAKIRKDIPDVNIFGSNVVNEDLLYLLQTVNITDSVEFHLDTAEIFPYDIPVRAKYFLSSQTKWISIKQLMKLECTDIIANDTDFTDEELSTFILSWMKMETNENLTSLMTPIKSPKAVLSKLPHVIDAKGNVILTRDNEKRVCFYILEKNGLKKLIMR